jgi:leader peptidase (prepilin peptidase)/N-methyltransferase
MPPWLAIFFLFALGACVGSFLNVVVWRLPRIEVPAGTSLFGELWLTLRGLSTPPSHCPKCDTRLSWRDNIPIFGWLLLAGKCRYCKAPISSRYPIVELATAILFAGTYALVFLADLGPCAPEVTTTNQYGVATTIAGGLDAMRDGWLLWLYLPLIACLLAASLIDFELLIIPIWIPWLLVVIGLAVHGIFDRVGLPGSLVQSSTASMMALGASIGLILSLVLMRVGVIRRSFLEGEPMTKNEQDAVLAGTAPTADDLQSLPLKDYSAGEVRREMWHELLFLLAPIGLAAVCGILAMKSNAGASFASTLSMTPHLNAILGALLGAHIAALVVWATRILGSLGFGREAMGMGDVHLMFGVGAVLGAGMSSVAFFLSPLPALLIHLYLVFTDPKRAVPFGPYLSFASILVIFVYCPISEWLGPGLQGLGMLLRQVVGLG